MIRTKNSKQTGSGGIRTHASEETGALNQRLRPLGHATDRIERVPFFVGRLTIAGKTSFNHLWIKQSGFRGAMVARLTPDQEAACSNHVGIRSTSSFLWNSFIRICCSQNECALNLKFY